MPTLLTADASWATIVEELDLKDGTTIGLIYLHLPGVHELRDSSQHDSVIGVVSKTAADLLSAEGLAGVVRPTAADDVLIAFVSPATESTRSFRGALEVSLDQALMGLSPSVLWYQKATHHGHGRFHGLGWRMVRPIPTRSMPTAVAATPIIFRKLRRRSPRSSLSLQSDI